MRQFPSYFLHFSYSKPTWTLQFGVSISYLIILGALVPRVVVSFVDSPPAFLLDRRLWIALSLTILVPLAFLRRLDSLRFTSYVALIAVADLVSQIDRISVAERTFIVLMACSLVHFRSLLSCGNSLTAPGSHRPGKSTWLESLHL
jgi:uncharacterized membrane protein YhaH (DUF805 family)